MNIYNIFIYVCVVCVCACAFIKLMLVLMFVRQNMMMMMMMMVMWPCYLYLIIGFLGIILAAHIHRYLKKVLLKKPNFAVWAERIQESVLFFQPKDRVLCLFDVLKCMVLFFILGSVF